MYASVIQVVVILLLYSTQESGAPSPFSLPGSLAALALSFVGYFLVSLAAFRLLSRGLARNGPAWAFVRFDRTVSRLGVLAVFLSAFYIHGLGVKGWMEALWPVRRLPTLGALLVLVFFFLHLYALWSFSWGVYSQVQADPLPRRGYVRSNVRLALPALFPWLVISLAADCLDLLPWPPLSRFLGSLGGQFAFLLAGMTLLVLFGPVFIIRFWGCRPLPASPARLRMEALCARAGLKYRDIVLWPIFGRQMITAGVMGITGRFRYVLVTRGLLDQLTPLETDAVLAHEIGHVKKYHIPFYVFCFLSFAPLFFIVFTLAQWGLGALEMRFALAGAPDALSPTVRSASLALAGICVFLAWFRYLFGWFIRNFERQADLFVFQLVPDAMPLVSVFAKITRQTGRPPEEPNWHHYSIAERVEQLLLCQEDKSRYARHDRKVKRAAAVFALGVVLLAAGAWGVSLEPVQRGAGAWLVRGTEARADTLLERLETLEPARLRILGELYYVTGKEEKALRVYERLVKVEPGDAEAWNALAWMLATAREERLRNPDGAVKAALRAVDLSRSPHILDTLAEALYAAGEYGRAAQVSMEALSKDREGAPYYREQLAKFHRAMEKERGKEGKEDAAR
jgi:Zn-dependent protease with chaperone function